jgi:hypothetical protein
MRSELDEVIYLVPFPLKELLTEYFKGTVVVVRLLVKWPLQEEYPD